MKRQSESDLHVQRKKGRELYIKPREYRTILKQATLERLEGNFGKLPLEMLLEIGKCLCHMTT